MEGHDLKGQSRQLKGKVRNAKLSRTDTHVFAPNVSTRMFDRARCVTIYPDRLFSARQQIDAYFTRFEGEMYFLYYFSSKFWSFNTTLVGLSKVFVGQLDAV